MLQDSTKSPQFVKTVPKRGYQLISSVDIATQSQAHEVADKAEALSLDSDDDNSSDTHNFEEAKQPYSVSNNTTPIEKKVPTATEGKILSLAVFSLGYHCAITNLSVGK